jgi:uncharacterized protein (TIGR02611 family)
VSEQTQQPNPTNVAVQVVAGALRFARRLVIAVVGVTVLLLGVVMVLTPGPASVVIPIGLGILAIEFAWARRLLRRVRTEVQKTIRRVSGRGEDSAPSSPNHSATV